MRTGYLLVLIFSILFNGNSQKYSLRIVMTGFKQISGNVHIALYNNSENFPKKGKEFALGIFPVQSDSLVLYFQQIPEGNYSLAFFHDANSDGICNLNFAGLPTEGFGFSNYRNVKLKTPSFEETSFYLKNDTTVVVKLFFIL